MLRPGIFVAGALALSVFAVADASAQARGTTQERDACTRDVTRLCRKVMEQGDMVVLGCLQQNRAKLSKGCAKVLKDNGQ